MQFLLILPAAAMVVGCDTDAARQAGPSTPPADGYLLRIDGKAGDKFSYDMTMVMEHPTQGSVQMSASWDAEITAVEDDKFTYEMATSGTKMSFQGQEMSLPDMPSMTFVVDKQGNVITGPGDSGIGSTSRPMGATFPDHKVKVGDTWTAKVPIEDDEADFTYTLTGVENVGGVNAVVIEATVSGTERLVTPQPMKMWIHPVNGQLLRGEYVMEVTEEGEKVRATMNVTKVDRK